MRNYLLIKSVLFSLLKTSAIMILIIISPLLFFLGYMIYSCNNTTIKEINFKKCKEKVLFSYNNCGFINPTNKLSIKIYDENNNVNEKYSSLYKSACYSFYYKITEDTLFIIQDPGCEFTKIGIKKSKLNLKIIYKLLFDEDIKKSNDTESYEEFPSPND